MWEKWVCRGLEATREAPGMGRPKAAGLCAPACPEQELNAPRHCHSPLPTIRGFGDLNSNDWGASSWGGVCILRRPAESSLPLGDQPVLRYLRGPGSPERL